MTGQLKHKPIEINTEQCIKNIQKKQKYYHDKHAGKPHKPLEIGDRVQFRNYKSEWQPGVITKTHYPRDRDYQIKTEQDKEMRRNRVKIIKTNKTIHRPGHNGTETENGGSIPLAPNGQYQTRYGRKVHPVKHFNNC